MVGSSIQPAELSLFLHAITEHGARDLSQGLPLDIFSLPLFSSLGREVIMDVLLGAERRVYQAGELIVREGTPGRSMFCITQGQVSMVRQAEAPVPQVVAVLGAGELFGELSLLCEAPRLSSAVAARPVVLLEFFRDRMEKAAARSPLLEQALYRLYTERLPASMPQGNPLFASWLEALRRTSCS